MKNVKIYLNDKIWIDLQKLIVSRLLAVANSGGGKSWLVRRIVEQAFKHVQIIIIDPEGEFSTLREKFDFILCGKGMDAPAETRSAALLARKLLESKSSAIIDLYELHPQDRKKFVRLFFESMINAPKELYNDCLIFLDEAHRFAPEKEESEASSAVIEMASLGRKRGFCLIPVTQRVSKLSKDVAAECNNKLMGRASLDLDRKRTADELGITDKAEVLALRNLEPGEFFAFGPAISNEVIRLKVGDVQTSMPKAGRQTKVSPPSPRVKKELAALADLPAEAEAEAKTVAELKVQINLLKKAKIVGLEPKPTKETVMGVSQWREYGKTHGYWDYFDKQAKETAGKLIKQYVRFISKMLHITKDRANQIITSMEELEKQMPKEVAEEQTEKDKEFVRVMEHGRKVVTENLPRVQYQKGTELREIPVLEAKNIMSARPMTLDDMTPKKITGGALRIVQVLASRHPMKLTKTQLATFAKLKASSGTFGTYLATVSVAGLIQKNGDLYEITQEGMDFVGDTPSIPQTPEAIQRMWLDNLQGGSKRMFEYLLQNYPNQMTRAELGEGTGLNSTSGTFGTYLAILNTNGLVDVTKEGVKASDNLFM